MRARATLVLRTATLVLAFVHLFPARKHLALFVATPSLAEAWKGFGAVAAIAFYLLPVRTQAHLLGAAWRQARPLLVALGWLLAAAHLAPALDHLPRLLGEASWPDAWRGLGASFAAAWFVLPIERQARFLAHVRDVWTLRVPRSRAAT
jgi:hypothetical protein